MQFPYWLIQPFDTDIFKVAVMLQEEMSDLQNDVVAQQSYKRISTMMWFDNVMADKYAQTCQRYLTSFPSSYLVECAFSFVSDLMPKKRRRLDICKR